MARSVDEWRLAFRGLEPAAIALEILNNLHGYRLDSGRLYLTDADNLERAVRAIGADAAIVGAAILGDRQPEKGSQ